MRKFYKIFTVFLLCSFILCTTAGAVTYSDVTETSCAWGKDAIEELTAKGIFEGYEDGTFKPNEPVTKYEALILISRLLGVNESINTNYAAAAQKEYIQELFKYNLSSTKEIAYLLYKGVLNTQELDKYISNENKDKPLKRFEAAVLFTKAIYKENEVKNKWFTVLPFKDEDDIPIEAKVYVECVKDEKIINGINTASGDVNFAPKADVSRAQMAVMLRSVLNKNKTNVTKTMGVITNVNEVTGEINFKNAIDVTESCNVNNCIIRLDGKNAKVSDFKIGFDIVLTKIEGKEFMLEGLSPTINENPEGIIVSVDRFGSDKNIRIKNSQEEIKTYPLADKVKVIYNGKEKTADGKDNTTFLLTMFDQAKLFVVDGKVVKVEAQSRVQDIDCTIEQVVIPDMKVRVRLSQNDIREYEVMEDVSVTKNKKDISLLELKKGDRASIKLEYNKIKSVDARSVKKERQGIIEEIVISKTPSITINENGEILTCNISWNANMTMDGEPAQIYDLRLGDNVELKLESDVVISLIGKSISKARQFTGPVNMINSNYGFFEITVKNDITGEVSTKQIFINKNTKIIKSDKGKEAKFKDIEVGDILTVIGSEDTGVFEANMIVIIDK